MWMFKLQDGIRDPLTPLTGKMAGTRRKKSCDPLYVKTNAMVCMRDGGFFSVVQVLLLLDIPLIIINGMSSKSSTRV